LAREVHAALGGILPKKKGCLSVLVVYACLMTVFTMGVLSWLM
jgi:hypothetical protein